MIRYHYADDPAAAAPASGAAAPAAATPAMTASSASIAATTPQAAAQEAWWSPIVNAGTTGLVAYSTARGIGIEPGKAKGLGVTLGLLTIISQYAITWLKSWAAKQGA
jgi:hypothetical protein